MTIQEALNFTTIYSELSSLKMPFKLAFKFYKINNEAESAVLFYKEKVEELVSEYAERDDEGKVKTTETGISLKPETAEECQKKLEELQSVKWESENFLFTKEEIEMLDDFELTPIQWSGLFPFLSE